MFIFEIYNRRANAVKHLKLEFDVDTNINHELTYFDVKGNVNIRVLDETGKISYFNLYNDDTSTMLDFTMTSNMVTNNIQNCMNKLKNHKELINLLYEYDDNGYKLMYELECTFGVGQSGGYYYRSSLQTIKIVSLRAQWLPMVKNDIVGKVGSADKYFFPPHVLRDWNRAGHTLDNLFVCNYRDQAVYLINVKYVGHELKYFIVAKLHDSSYSKCDKLCITNQGQCDINVLEEFLTNQAKSDKIHVHVSNDCSNMIVGHETMMRLPKLDSCCSVTILE